MGTWVARTGWRVQSGNKDSKVKSFLVNTYLCTVVLAVLLVIGGVKKNPGPSVEGESFLQVMCRGCDRNLKSGTQCDTCGR